MNLNQEIKYIMYCHILNCDLPNNTSKEHQKIFPLEFKHVKSASVPFDAS